MRLIKRSLQRDEWKEIKSKEITIKKIDDKNFCGTICLMKILEIEEPVVITGRSRPICIADKNYVWLQFAPKDQHWWLTVLYDDHHNLLESYFDITKESDFQNEDNPTFIDMFLDIVFSPNEKPKLLDEDELEEALLTNLITKKEHDLAFLVAKQIIEDYNRNISEYYEFVHFYFELLQNEGGNKNEI